MKPNRIKFFREARGVSRQELAEALGVTYQTVYFWETGRSGHKLLEKHFAIADFLEVPRDLFFAKGLGEDKS